MVKSKSIPKLIIKKHGKEIFFDRGDENSAIGNFKVKKIAKDHKHHKMVMSRVIKKIWGSEEDKVICNLDGDYRPHGSKELIESAVINDVPDADRWYKEYLKFENQVWNLLCQITH